MISASSKFLGSGPELVGPFKTLIQKYIKKDSDEYFQNDFFFDDEHNFIFKFSSVLLFNLLI